MACPSEVERAVGELDALTRRKEGGSGVLIERRRKCFQSPLSPAATISSATAATHHRRNVGRETL